MRGLRGSCDYSLEVSLPGRFTVIAGANGGGETTFRGAVYLAHTERFPSLLRHSAEALGTGDRDIELEYKFEGHAVDEGPLGKRLQDQSGRSVPEWSRRNGRGPCIAAWAPSRG